MFVPQHATMYAGHISGSVVGKWFIALAFLVYMEIKNRGENVTLQYRWRYSVLNKLAYVLIAVFAILFYQQGQEFIYFQF
jgi:hypothetical protein